MDCRKQIKMQIALHYMIRKVFLALLALFNLSKEAGYLAPQSKKDCSGAGDKRLSNVLVQ